MNILETFTLQLNPWYYTGRKKRRLKRRIVGMVLVSLCLFQSPLAQDEESQCETYESEKCIHEVRLKIGKKSAEIRKSYTLSMFTPQGNEEPVAFFDYVGLEFYTCDPARGYVCNKESETVFSVTTPCAPSTKFSFFAEGEKALPCMSIKKEKSVSELESDSKEPADFQNDDSRTSNQIKNTIIIAVCVGVIISGIIAATLYLLRKRGILSTCFEIKRSKKVIDSPVEEQEISFLFKDLPYDDEQRTVQDDTTVIQELS